MSAAGRLLVTGASGFLGSSLAARAEAQGWQVTRVVRTPAPGAHVADLTRDDLTELVASCAPHAVVHAAGSASVAASVSDPADGYARSVLTFRTVLESVRRAGTGSVVANLSSAAVYGQPERLPVGEGDPTRPLSPYGFHKLAAELLAAEYGRFHGVPALSCRLFSVVGARQRRLLTYEIAAQALDPEATEIVLRGTGHEARDFLHVDDLSDAVLGLVALPVDRLPLEVNVATGVETSIADLAHTVADAAGTAKHVRFRGQVSTTDPERWVADIGRLRGLLPHWQPRPLTNAVGDCVRAWCDDQALTAGRA